MPCADVLHVQRENVCQNVSRRIALLHRYNQEFKLGHVVCGNDFEKNTQFVKIFKVR